MIRFFTVIILVAATAGPALADWEYTHWGMTAQQVIDASGGAARMMPAERRYRNDAGHFEITVEARGKPPARRDIGFEFDLPGGGLRCVLINAQGDEADTLHAELLQRYGAPQQDFSFGPTQSWTWTTPDTVELTINNTPKAAVVNHCAPHRS